jgi:hypothetical protein
LTGHGQVWQRAAALPEWPHDCSVHLNYALPNVALGQQLCVPPSVLLRQPGPLTHVACTLLFLGTSSSLNCQGWQWIQLGVAAACVPESVLSASPSAVSRRMVSPLKSIPAATSLAGNCNDKGGFAQRQSPSGTVVTGCLIDPDGLDRCIVHGYLIHAHMGG